VILPDKHKNILRMILRLSREPTEVTATMVSDALGFNCCARISDETKALEAAKLITKTRIHRSKMLLSLTEKGRGIATLLPEISVLAKHGAIRDRGVQKYSAGPTILDPDDPGLISAYAGMPAARLGEADIAALYRGARYENYRGREIIDNRPVSRPPALEIYGSNGEAR
jgi:hypothetical protein